MAFLPFFRRTGRRSNLAALIPSLVWEVDSTIATSANGGLLWKNLTRTPADSSAQTAYDLNSGASSSPSSDDPKFTGSPNSAAAYWLYDGGDIFTLAGSNTTFLQRLHRTTTTQAFWFGRTLRYFTNGGSVIPFFTTATNGTSVGFTARIVESTGGDAGKLSLRQRGDTATAIKIVTAMTPLVNGQDYLVLFSVAAGGGEIRAYINSSTAVVDGITYNACANNASSNLILDRDTAAVVNVPNLTRGYWAAMGNAVLTDAQAATILTELRTRHGRAYA